MFLVAALLGLAPTVYHDCPHPYTIATGCQVEGPNGIKWCLGHTECTDPHQGEEPMRPLALALSACALSLSGCAHGSKLTEQAGVSVELAYQGAALAEQTAIRAGFVSPDEARHLLVLDNQAYDAVCYTRTAYDLANGGDPEKRMDGCRPETKSPRFSSYAAAAASAVIVIRQLLAALQDAQPGTIPDATPPGPGQ